MKLNATKITLLFLSIIGLILTFGVIKNAMSQSVSYHYEKGETYVDWHDPRCSCDTDKRNKNCPDTFAATASDPQKCYDQYLVSGWSIWPFNGNARKSIRYNKVAVEGAVPTPFPESAVPGADIGVCVDPPYPDTSDAKKPLFKWSASGHPQKQYALQVSKDSSFSSLLINTGVVNSSDDFYSTPINTLPIGRAGSPKVYYWRVSIADSYAWTGWTGCESFNLENHRPTTSSLSSKDNCCGVVKPRKDLSWKFEDQDSDSYQTAYQIQIDKNPSFNNIIFDTKKVSSSSNNYTTPKGILDFNTTYYWRIKVWDDFDDSSEWNTSSFITPLHQYPVADYLCNSDKCDSIAEHILKGQVLILDDNSQAFGGSVISRWKWTLPDGVSLLKGTLNSQEIKVRFDKEGKMPIKLEVADSDNYHCSVTKVFNVVKWNIHYREIHPSF